jgi:hypothetical protein
MEHSNPLHTVENAPEESITRIYPAGSPKKFPLKRHGFFFHFSRGLHKLGGLKAKWTTSSRPENCR